MESLQEIRGGTENLSIKGGSTKKIKNVKPSPKLRKSIVKKPRMYSVSGQARSPSKDFFELIVYADEIIWRKWRIRFTGKCVPSEEKYTIKNFMDSEIVQNDIEACLGDDVINIAMGFLSNNWLPRLPIKVLEKITCQLSVKDISSLQKVCTTFNKRLRNDIIWSSKLLNDFGIDANSIIKEKSLRKYYLQETLKRKENKIDWNNV